jgi:hypothetical protein
MLVPPEYMATPDVKPTLRLPLNQGESAPETDRIGANQYGDRSCETERRVANLHRED